MLAYDYPLLDVFVSMLTFFLFIIWLYLLVLVISDLFRDRGQSAVGKAVWVLFLIVFPYIGVLTYIFVHGGDMTVRKLELERLQAAQLRY